MLGRPGVPFDARRMWPSAMQGLGVDVRGKVPTAEQAETGRVIARLTDLGLGSRLRSLLAADAPDSPVPDDLMRAGVQVLAAWDWAQRPALVVHVGSLRRPLLIADLAARLADIGRLTNLGGVPHLGRSSSGRTNSALRLRDVWNAYEISAALSSQLNGQSVLLVDDVVDSGWTCTVVARLLRRAGAGAVYPFALALAA
jgi:ATP-dependent DNA helicase RecQ